MRLVSSVLVGAAAPLGAGVYPHQDTSLTVEQISPHLYVMYGAGANVVFLATSDGVLVVDAGNGLAHGRRVATKILEVTRQPIRYLLLTHYHGDHVLGDAQFAPGATVIAHVRTLEHMEEVFVRNALPANLENPLNVVPLLEHRMRDLETTAGSLRTNGSPELERVLGELTDLERRIGEMRRFEVILPSVTFTERLSLRLGGCPIELLYLGPGHTDGDVVVLFPDEQTAAIGDLLWTNGWVPRLDADAGGSADNWPGLLRDVGALAVERIVPGHGLPVGKAEYEHTAARWTAYLDELRDSVASYIDRGASLEDAKKSLTLPGYRDMGLNDQLLPYNIEAAYRESLKRRQAGAGDQVEKRAAPT